MTLAATVRFRRFTPLRLAIFFVIVLVWVIVDGSERVPTGAASGLKLMGSNPASRPSGDVLRVATFNIDGKDGQATIDTLRGFDLIGIQEAHGKSPFSTSNNVQALGDALNMPWLFAPVERQWWHDGIGDGVLTTLSLNHWQRFPLADDNADSNRELLVLTLQFAGKPLNVLITHLERHNDHANELATAAFLFLSMQTPAILMGDFNCEPGDAGIMALRNASGVADPIGDAAKSPDDAGYDRIFVRGLHSRTTGLIDKGASDHPLAWAELQINGD